MKITQGEAYWEFNPVSSLSPNGQITVKAGPAGTPICVLPIPLGGTNENVKANAQLIVDAINTKQQIMGELTQLHDAYMKSIENHLATLEMLQKVVSERDRMRTVLEKCYHELRKAAKNGNYPESFLQENGGRGLNEIRELL